MIENHDELRATAVFDGPKIAAAALLVSVIPGLRFFHEGQLVGRRIKVPVQLCRRPIEYADVGLASFYEKMLESLKDEVLKNGSSTMLEPQPAWSGNPSHDRLFAFWWALDDRRRLAVINFAPDHSQAFFRLPRIPTEAAMVRFRDALSDRSYDRNREEVETRGMYLDMPGYDVHLFKIENI